jgi:hypothetical protein
MRTALYGEHPENTGSGAAGPGGLTVAEATSLLRVCHLQAKRLWARYQAQRAKGLHCHIRRPVESGDRGHRARGGGGPDQGALQRAGGAGPGQRLGPTLLAGTSRATIGGPSR